MVGPVQQPNVLGTSPGNSTCSEIYQLAAGFSNTHNYGERISGQRRGRQESLNRQTSGRFYTVHNSHHENSAVNRVFTKEVCLLPSPSWNKVPRGRMKAFLISRGMCLDTWGPFLESPGNFSGP